MSQAMVPEESAELSRLRRQVEDLTLALGAIRSGDVDALVVDSGGDRQLYHRTTADRPYQVLIENMAAGVATVSGEGRILFANQRLAEWLHCERAALVGRPLQDLLPTYLHSTLGPWLAKAAAGARPRHLSLRRSDGIALPVLAALEAVEIEEERMFCLVVITDSRAGRPEDALAFGHNLPWHQAQTPPRPSPSPIPSPPHGQALALIVGLQLVIFAADLLTPREFVLVPFYWLPLVLAASFAGPRQILGLALMNMTLIVLTGLRWSLLGGIAYWLGLLAIALVAPVSMVLAVQRHRLGKLLRDSERHYRMLAENASDVVFRANLEGVTEWISTSVTAITGWPPEVFINRSFRPFVHPDDVPRLRQADAAFARGERQVFRLRVRRAYGDYHWVEVNGRGAVDAAGAVVAILGSWRNIQAEMEAEAMGARMRSRLATTLDSLLDPHVVLQACRDANGTIVDFTYIEANQAACRYNLLSHEQLIGRTVMNLLPAHGATGLLAMYSQVVETGEALLLDDFVYPHDFLGKARHYDIRAVPLGDELSYTWRDVSDRVETQQRLADSEEEYRLLAMNASDVVVRLRDDRILWVSPSLTTALGWQTEEWIGRHVTGLLHPDDHADYDIEGQALGRGDTIVSRHRFRAREGTWHWVELHAGPYRDRENRIDGVVATFRIVDREMADQQKLERYARFDELTGLLNRREVLDRIDADKVPVLRTGLRTAILFCDLDRFKDINDRCGHAAGDQLLRTVAERLRGCLRHEDLAARVGGDELLVVLRGVQDLDNAVAIGEKISRVIQEPVQTAAGELQISLSIGVTLAQPGESSDELMARADAAMYEAKGMGRNRVIPIRGSS
jgi:diguanylate cyclase (GGDEF)-like protein/PAS domain S-box-containing protein